MKQSFFDLGTGTTEVTKKAVKKSGCNACRLYKDCDNPYFEPLLSDNKKVVLILENPSVAEDETGEHLSGESGKWLKAQLEKLGLDLSITYACKCAGSLADENIQACKGRLFRELSEINPSVVIPCGSYAIKAIIGDELSGRISGVEYKQFIGEQIPLNKFWVCPVEAHYIAYSQLDKDLIIAKSMLSMIEKAVYLQDEPLPEINPKVKILSEAQAIEFFQRDFDRELYAFDYETTGLKPHADGHELISMSICSGAVSYAFLITEKIKPYLKIWLENENIKKCAHNLMFEDSWSYVRAGADIKGWTWDTILGAHCLNNNKPTSQKFLVFSKFGKIYDAEIDQYLQAVSAEVEKYGNNAINKIRSAPVDKLLEYNALDSWYCYKLYEYQKAEFEKLDKKFYQGFKFFIAGAIALSHVHRNPIHLDMAMLYKQQEILTRRIDHYFSKIMESAELKQWKSRQTFNPDSGKDMAQLLYNYLGYEKPGKKSRGSSDQEADEKALEAIGTEFTKNVLQYRKLKKIRDTYIGQFLREQVDGKMYPVFSIHIPKSFRSCIAKGSLVLTPHNFKKYPNGTPIEEIKAGDSVYCFDDNLNLQIKKVLWAGKTGHRKVVRIHYMAGFGVYQYLDVTPEHRIRLVDGRYVQAKDLLNDFRKKSEKYLRKSRVLSCRRQGDRLFPTNSKEVLEHRFIYEKFSGELLPDEDVIHHIDKNHLNHEFLNLEKLTKTEHARLHAADTIFTEMSQKKALKRRKELLKSGQIKMPSGKNHPGFLNLSREDCFSLLIQHKWKLTDVPYDFDTFKKYCTLQGIDIKQYLRLVDGHGVLIGKEKLIELLKLHGFSKVQTILKIGYYRLKEICEAYNIGYERSWGNQVCKKEQIVTGNNHAIISLEYLDAPVDVYDLEIEDCHNFIVNELCVHNSGQNPNLQNIPKRDPEAKKRARSLIKPSTGNRLAEYDYKSVEVAVSACVHKDKNMIAYVTDSKNDMHRDTAADLFMRKPADVQKAERQLAKNGFVFPSFYGSTSKATGPALWDEIEKSPELKKVLREKKITNFEKFQNHVKKVEDIFWNERFAEYQAWKERSWKLYQKRGYVDLYTGFRSQGPMSFTELINREIQGPAFHCLLWTLINVQAELDKGKCPRSKIIGQVHDSLVCDIHPEEETEFDGLVKKYAMEKIREHWDWIIVPLTIEKEVGTIDGDWTTLKEVKF